MKLLKKAYMELHAQLSKVTNGQRFGVNRYKRKTLGGWDEKRQERYKKREIGNVTTAMQWGHFIHAKSVGWVLADNQETWHTHEERRRHELEYF